MIIQKEWTNITYTKPIPSINLKNFILVDEGQNKNQFVKSKECSKEGLYMYLPPYYLLKEEETDFRRKDKVIVHEWGQLRWGLFSEYHPFRDEKFYLDVGRWKPTVCTEHIQGLVCIGKLCSNEGHICYPNDGGRRMPYSFNLCPFREKTANASIMGYQYCKLFL
ncbi:hypothetical protein DPMN_143813 [Dreissena polymorpha]|uniref:Calcium-activated chloride channel N-terminal domain-containing protein n=1 Tax=Dreissena polymorpha TaxID=45954 RepID=A0A9D4GGX1_DREPO|nr:hypothetical protein DPMN_143813 [Dreissena polymorpha]